MSFEWPGGLHRSFRYMHLESDMTWSGDKIVMRFAGMRSYIVTIEGLRLEKLYYLLQDDRMRAVRQATRVTFMLTNGGVYRECYDEISAKRDDIWWLLNRALIGARLADFSFPEGFASDLQSWLDNRGADDELNERVSSSAHFHEIVRLTA